MLEPLHNFLTKFIVLIRKRKVQRSLYHLTFFDVGTARPSCEGDTHPRLARIRRLRRPIGIAVNRGTRLEQLLHPLKVYLIQQKLYDVLFAIFRFGEIDLNVVRAIVHVFLHQDELVPELLSYPLADLLGSYSDFFHGFFAELA